jgi:exodeoxyribonuclease VII small subunit
MNASTNLSFEQSFDQLEKILEKMNQPNLTLEESILLFEEADRLVKQCSIKIDEAEKRIEVIVKNRSDQSIKFVEMETT